jgi:hypothetical protein
MIFQIVFVLHVHPLVYHNPSNTIFSFENVIKLVGCYEIIRLLNYLFFASSLNKSENVLFIYYRFWCVLSLASLLILFILLHLECFLFLISYYFYFHLCIAFSLLFLITFTSIYVLLSLFFFF